MKEDRSDREFGNDSVGQDYFDVEFGKDERWSNKRRTEILYDIYRKLLRSLPVPLGMETT